MRDGDGAYATWDPESATDEPDGLPDRAIVSLVEDLRRRGIVTLQSCAGHLGSDDGTLWIRAATVEETSIPRAFPFARVQRVAWPEDRWELIWEPQNADYAMSVLRDQLRAVPAKTIQLPIPITWERTVYLTTFWPISDDEWERMLSVLAVMRPGVVRARVLRGGSEAGYPASSA